MLDSALSALGQIFGCPCLGGLFPETLVFLLLGVAIGLAIGVIPGLAGVTGLAILIPFTFDMNAGPAIAMLIGMLVATTSTDTIPAVLFAVPGTAGAQATILDGFVMAQKGEAGRALGAAYAGSMIGGLIGAVVLGVSIPVLRPAVLAFGSPEFLVLGVMGITMVAVLSRGAALKGIIMAALGLLLATVGRDPIVGTLRWDFGQLYLYDGIPLEPVAIGLFALPELADMVIKGTAIADVPRVVGGVMDGIRDVFKHWFLVLRSSIFGTWLGAIPGLGLAVVDWLAYGHALQTEKGAAASFGKGDVRGVIAPESAVNAKNGGALIPTLAFGIPGSAAMALLLGAFLIQGINPGPEMLSEHLDITYTIIWSLALANVFATLITLALTNPLARISLVNVHYLVPGITIAVVLAAFQSSRSYGDVLLLLSIGAFGWIMKRFRWPRPPLLLAFILGPILERYLSISMQAYGFNWLSRPLVLVLTALTVAGVVYGYRSEHREMRATSDSND